MKHKKIVTQVVKGAHAQSSVLRCQCSKCGQVSHVVPQTEHAFCRGFKIHKPMPAMFANLCSKVKGTWEIYAEPELQIASIMPNFNPAHLDD